MLTNPTIRDRRVWLAGGAIGEVTHIAADFGVADRSRSGTGCGAPELGGGALLDLGVYPVAPCPAVPWSAGATAWARRCPRAPTRTRRHPRLRQRCARHAARRHGRRQPPSGRSSRVTGRIEIDRLFWRPECCTVAGPTAAPSGSRVAVRGNGMGYEARRSCVACGPAGPRAPVIPARRHARGHGHARLRAPSGRSGLPSRRPGDCAGFPALALKLTSRAPGPLQVPKN